MTSTSKELLQLAFARHRAGELQEAEALYRSVLSRDPEDLNGLQLLGLLMHEGGRSVDAVAILQQAVAVLSQRDDRNAQYAALYNNLGNALRAAGRDLEAIESYRRGLDLDPNLAELHINLGGELLRRGDLSGAIASYEAARALGRISPRCLCSLSGAYAATEQFSKAQGAYREAMESLLPSASIGRDAGARVDMLSGTPPNRAESDTSRMAGHQGKPDHIEAVEALVCTLIANRQPDLAVDVCRRLAETTPNDPHAQYVLGKTLRDAGDHQSAIAAFQRCLKLNPMHAEALYDLAIVLVRTGFGRLAVPFFEMALRVRPDDASCHVEFGNLLQSLGETERAFACFHRASALRPLTTWSATNKRADFSVLLIASPGAGNTPPHFLFGDADFDRHFFTLLPDVAPDLDLLRSHGDIVVNLISDVDQGRQALSIAADVIDALGKPTINHPRKILATGRDQISKLLAGVARCRAPKTIRCTRDDLASPNVVSDLHKQGLSLPLLLRVAGTHGGDAFEKIDTPNDVVTFLAQYPESEFYATEYVDYQSRDGYFRKYRFVLTNGEILPYHLAIADQWKVHHFRTEMGRHTWMQDEEKMFLENPSRVFSDAHYAAMREMNAAVDLQFFGLDCSLDGEGRIVVFEVNAAMLIHDDNSDFPYKTPYCARVKRSFDTMLARVAADAKQGNRAHSSTEGTLGQTASSGARR